MTQAQKGTFLQLPSVFIETCDLPETAQIMYIRMLHNFGYKGVYTGSLRKLAHVVRMSKSTVDRMLDVLARSHLISRGVTSASETAQSILQISLDPEYLWNANIDYCTSHTVPIWDSIKEGEVSQDETNCPNLGRTVPVAGQAVPKMGQAVPTRTLKRGTNITKTSNTTNKTKKDSLVVSALAENDAAGLSFLSSVSSFEETLHDVQQEEVARRDTEPLTHTISIPVLLSQEDKRTTPSQKKTGEKGKQQKCLSIKECSPEIQARRRKWQAHFNERRGGDLLALKKDRINESAGIASLVDTYTDAQITALDHHLYAVDDFWSKPAKRREVNGERVWQKASMTRERLKELGHWPGSTGICEDATTFREDQFSCIPEGYNATDEFRQYYGINEPREVEHATV